MTSNNQNIETVDIMKTDVLTPKVTKKTQTVQTIPKIVYTVTQTGEIDNSVKINSVNNLPKSSTQTVKNEPKIAPIMAQKVTQTVKYPPPSSINTGSGQKIPPKSGNRTKNKAKVTSIKMKKLFEYFGQKVSPPKTQCDNDKKTSQITSTEPDNSQKSGNIISGSKGKLDSRKQRHLLIDSPVSGHSTVKRLVKDNINRKGSPKIKSKLSATPQERSQLGILFEKLRQKGLEINSNTEKTEDSKSNKEVEINVRTVNNGHSNENVDEFDRNKLMKFDENGKLVQLYGQKDQNSIADMTHAHDLGPKLIAKDLYTAHVNSPEKLNFKSRISIFEYDEILKHEKNNESVKNEPKSSINSNIKYAKVPSGQLERSASFSTLVRSTNQNTRNLSRKYCISVGADLDDEKNRKKSKAETTSGTPTRNSFRKVRQSYSFDTDSPGKRKLSPESSNLDSQNRGLGKRTMRD